MSIVTVNILMNNQYKDLFNREIKVGDYIVYSAVDGRSGVLRAGKVVELTQSKEIDYSTEEKIPKIRAKSAYYGFIDWKGDTRIDGWSKQKDVSLGFFERIIIAQKDTLPKELLEILDN